MYYVYLLQSLKDKKFYTGFTSDSKRRFEEHNTGLVTATNYSLPLNLVYYEFCLNQHDAIHREKYLKSVNGKRYIKNRLKKFPPGIVFHRVAEGFERDGNKEFINFLYIAKGSNGEVRSQAYSAFDVQFINQESFEDMLRRTDILKIKIINLILTLKFGGPKGYK